jgi:hypothetical protein
MSQEIYQRKNSAVVLAASLIDLLAITKERLVLREFSADN